MPNTDIKSQIAQKVDRLPPNLLAVANDFLESLLAESQQASTTTPEIDSDPLIGLIDGSPNLAANAEDILRKEIKSGSGWTWRQ